MPPAILTSLPGLNAYSDLKSLLCFWQKLAASRGMPSRLDLDPVALKPWIGNLLLVEVVDESRFRYRVYGTKIKTLLGHDFHDREVGELPQPHREEAIGDYMTVVSRRGPHFVERERLVHLPHEVSARAGTIGKLSLPFSADGRTVNQIIAGIIPRD